MANQEVGLIFLRNAKTLETEQNVNVSLPIKWA